MSLQMKRCHVIEAILDFLNAMARQGYSGELPMEWPVSSYLRLSQELAERTRYTAIQTPVIGGIRINHSHDVWAMIKPAVYVSKQANEGKE